MSDPALEICRAVLRLVEPGQEFLLEENFETYAAGYPARAFVSEGRFEDAAMSLFVAVLVPFVVDVLKGGATDALKGKVKEGLDRLFRRQDTAREEEIASLRADIEKLIAKTKLSVRERDRLRVKLHGALDFLAAHPYRTA